jgi:DNA-binding SARP family transcriptional activator
MRFLLLGPVSVEVQGQRHSLPRAQNRGMLALLALNPGRAMSPRAVTDAMWGGAGPESARTQVYGAIRQIRYLLAQLGHPNVLSSDRFGYRLNVEPDTIDASRFERLVGQARAAAKVGEHEQAERLLRHGLELFTGKPLFDAAGAYVESTRARLADARLTAVEDLADLELSHGRPELVVADLTALVQENPLRERLRTRLMLALYRSGQPADALRIAREYRKHLAEQQGLDPGLDITELEHRILGADPSLRGRRDATREQLAAAPAPAAPAAAVPAQLPADIPDFTGRADALRQLSDLLDSGGGGRAVPVAVLTGTAGVGKTALATHWACRNRARFPDGQLYLDLRGFAPATPLSPIEALARLLHALGIPQSAIPHDEESAAALYRTVLADRRVLVVLDNARSASQVRPLLPGGAGKTVLVTSRDQLAGLVASEGARRITVDVLPARESMSLLARRLGTAHVDDEPAYAAELADLCAHLPLALCIAAANLAGHPHQSLADYVDVLREGNRLSALTVDGETDSAVRSAFDLSYDALPDEARLLFRRLGHIPGPDFDDATAAALAATTPESARRVLLRLTAAQLVHEPAAGRYAVHDLLRLYAAERLRDDTDTERAATEARLYAHYVDRMSAAANRLYPQVLHIPRATSRSAGVPFDEESAAIAWLEAERPNLIAAIHHAAEHGPRRVAWLLADALRGHFWLSMNMVDWPVAAMSALTAAESDGDLLGQAAARLSLGQLSALAGRPDDAIRHDEEAIRLSQLVGWTDCETAAVGSLAIAYWQSGQPRPAIEHFLRALELSRKTGRWQGEAVYLGNLGVAYAELGQLALASTTLAQGLALYRKMGSRSGEALSLGNLGEAERQLGLLDSAAEHLVEAVAIDQEIGSRHGEVASRRSLGAVHRDGGRLAEAAEHVQAALVLARETGHRRQEPIVLDTLASIEVATGRYADAIGHGEQALVLARELGDQAVEASICSRLANAYRLIGEHGSAKEYGERGLHLARAYGSRALEGRALVALAAIHLELGNRDEATSCAAEAVDVQRETGHRLGHARALIVLGRALAPEGAAHWRAALALLDGTGAPEVDEVRAFLDG